MESFLLWLERKTVELDNRGYRVRDVNGQTMWQTYGPRGGRFDVVIYVLVQNYPEAEWRQIVLDVTSPPEINDFRVERALNGTSVYPYRRIKP